MKYLILNNTTPFHTVISEKIALILSNNNIDNISFSPTFYKNESGSISIRKLLAFKSFFISLYYFLNGYTNIILTSPSIYSLPIILLAKLFNFKVLYLLHEPFLTRNDLYSKFVNIYNRIVVMVSSDIIVLSDFALNVSNKMFPSKNIIKINYPSGNSNFLNKKTRKYISFIGNLSDNKRLDIFIELAKKSNHEFLIAGSGNFDKYKNEIEKYNIKFINKFLSQKEYDGFMQQSLFVILPYESSTQSAVLFDSLRNRTPVISTDCGSFKEFIIHNQTGYVFNIKDFIPNALNVLNVSNKSKVENLSNNCLEFFNKELSDSHFEKKIINLLNI